MTSSGCRGQKSGWSSRLIQRKKSKVDADDESDGHNTPANPKRSHSTSGSSSSDTVPDRSVGTSTRAEVQGPTAEISPDEMHIIIQPPHEARPGITLIPPITVSVRNGASHTEEALSTGANSYWAFVSIVSEDGLIALSPPSTTLLSGTLADSIHEARLTNAERDVGHLSFHNLAINQPGHFRLRVSLLQMPRSQECLSMGGLGPTSVRNVASVLSHVIHVVNDASALQLRQ
ncbi:MAG: hypothetical protein Q9213_002812 [Squamulea squamosa]